MKNVDMSTDRGVDLLSLCCFPLKYLKTNGQKLHTLGQCCLSILYTASFYITCTLAVIDNLGYRLFLYVCVCVYMCDCITIQDYANFMPEGN